MWDLYKKLLFF